MINLKLLDDAEVSMNNLENSYVIELDNMNFNDAYMLIEKKWIEIQNGIPVNCITFKHSLWDVSQIEDFILKCKKKLIENNNFTWCVRSFTICRENTVLFISFYNSYSNLQSGKSKSSDSINSEFNFIKKYYVSPAFEQAIMLNELSNNIQTNEFSNEFINFLKKITYGNTLVTSTLASEILTQNGYFTVPQKLSYNSVKVLPSFSDDKIKLIENTRIATMFEDKIDVHSYNFFEVVHPAYAKQCTTLSYFISKYLNNNDEINCIDVGTGCGTTLIMIKEMLPNMKVHAIEPSEVAFKYLQENIKGISNITIDKIGFLELTINKQVPLIMSTGASHHFNTYFFFQKSWELISKEGLLIVADEFISPFKDINERNKNLILHHTSYMLSILFDIPHEVKQNLTNDELLLIEWFKRDIPLANFNACFNYIEESVYICENLLNRIRELSLSTKISDSFMAFYRLQILELEALVAGLCYEVEQKTYPERFIRMANLVGFTLLDHVRVHKTMNSGEFDAGTHVFVFKK